MSLTRKRGTGSVFQKEGRWYAVCPKEHGVRRHISGGFATRDEASLVLDAAVDIARKRGVPLHSIFSRSHAPSVTAAREELIVRLYNLPGATQASVAKLLGMTQAAVCVAIDRHLNRGRAA